jgi:Stress responsive A/B Barrel Domain
MKRLLARRLLPALAVTLAVGAASRPAEESGPQQAHMVFFTLKDHSQQARQTLVASCHKYLSGHEGTVSFSVGTIAEDVVEPVSDRDFDVALHLVFQDKAAGGKYLKDPRHLKFVEENRDSWSKVRVFDSYLTQP